MNTNRRITYLFLGVFTVFFILNCSQKKKNDSDISVNTNQNSMNINVSHNYTKIDSISLRNILEWKEYFDLKDFLDIYQKISAREALNNALELKGLTKKAIDSNRVDNLQSSAFKARIHVFENEVLRLSDMTYIPSITSNEVNQQVTNIFSTFSSLNSKIEHTFRKKSFDNSVKIDSIFNKIR